jgi:hypothetical protein
MAFIVVAATAEIIVSIVLIADLFVHCLSRKTHLLLLALLLVLEFALAVDIAIITSQASITREQLQPCKPRLTQTAATTLTSSTARGWPTR